MDHHEEQDRPSISNLAAMRGKRLITPPFAERVDFDVPTQGDYPKGHPEGMVVHFTAGHQDRKGRDALLSCKNDGLAYWYLDAQGKLWCAHGTDRWGYHAGKSTYPGIGSSVSTKLIGLEIACAGEVKPQGDGTFLTWFGRRLTRDQVRHSMRHDNIQPGYYQKYTEAQEDALLAIVLWLKNNSPDTFDIMKVVGHDEVAPDRKNDPGAALSCSMPEFRAKARMAWEAQA